MPYAIDRSGRLAAIALVGALVLLPATVQARDAAESPALRLAQAQSKPGAGATPRSGAPQARSSQQPASRDQAVEQQTGELKKKLQITPQQEAQFDAFAQQMRSNAQAMDSAMRQQAQNPPTTAVDDLKAIERLAETQLDGLKKLVPVFQSLYDTLSDQQKKTADQIFGQQQGGAGAAARPRG
jgi:periplasmic protein CpxP/Spy